VQLKASQYVRIVAEQRGIDVVLSLTAPGAATPLVRVDSVNGRFGIEPLSWLSTSDGDYTVKVASLNRFAAPGTYAIRIADLRAATPDDSVRISAQKALADGAKLMFEQGTAPALHQAITDFESGYMQWDQVQDTERKIDSLAFLVEAYDELSSLRKAGDPDVPFKVTWGDELKFLQQAGDGGDASAQDALGDIYYDGLGVPPNYKEALKWKRKAADQNREDAQSAVGYYYFNSSGVQQDYTEALKWFHKAADNGFVGAQLKLGDMYTNAQGTKQDLVEARRWYQRAADQGDKVAAERLTAMNK
jgi:TPR repeat protein